MRDQSHGRINGSAAAAFATICERNRNTASVLKERRRVRRRFVGQRYAQRFANSSRAIDKLFATSAPLPAALTNFFSLLMRFNDTAIRSIDRCRQREDRGQQSRGTHGGRACALGRSSCDGNSSNGKSGRTKTWWSSWFPSGLEDKVARSAAELGPEPPQGAHKLFCKYSNT
jgi:hypothetical protein